MLKDCIEVFKENFTAKGEPYILDGYVPKDGTYILVHKTEDGFVADEPFDIRYDKKTKQIIGSEHSSFPLVCFLDYYSKLIEMNKPMDSAKIIHTNNYLSFAVKKESLKEGKLKEAVIDGYYLNLLDPRVKYKKPKIKALYNEVEQALGPVDEELLNKIKEWVCQNFKNLELDLERKDYIKLFFTLEDEGRTKELYKKEGLRYILTNLYNNNDFNIEIDGDIYGLPNDNMGMNTKKPYLANKTRGEMELPYLLNREDVLTQAQFFDYLMGLASKRRYDVYIDTQERTITGYESGGRPANGMSGYYLRLRKEKNEVAIQAFDTIGNYNPNLLPVFHHKILIKVEKEDQGSNINKASSLETLIDDIFFNKCLISNYFTEPSDMLIQDGVLKNNLLIARDRIRLWFHGNKGIDINKLLDRVTNELIQSSIGKGYLKKAKKQMNLRWSLQDYFAGTDEREEAMNKVEEAIRKHIHMEEGIWEFDDDEEYYFAVGQMVGYFISKSRAAKKPLSFVNTFLNMREDRKIKEELQRLFKKYNYDMFPYEKRTKRLLSRILLYKPVLPVNKEMISAGLLSDNVIFEKQAEEK